MQQQNSDAPPARRTTSGIGKLRAKWENEHEIPGKAIYHYTSGDGLKGIITREVLWATHARFMNDPSELRYAADIIWRSIRVVVHSAARRRRSAGLIEEEKVRKQLFDIIEKAREEEPDYDDWIDRVLRKSQDQSEVYLACFCTEGDVSNQWFSYGCGGEGYSIGFQARNIHQGRSGNVDSLLRKVIYDERRQKELVKPWIECVLKLEAFELLPCASLLVFDPGSVQKVERFLSRPPIRRAERLAQQRLQRHRQPVERLLAQFLAECLVCFKDSGFHAEKEWRLIQFGSQGQKPNFRIRQGQLVPYVELNLKSQAAKGEPIREIIFGPTLEPETTKKALDMFYASTGSSAQKPEFNRSEVLLRRVSGTK